MTSRTTLNGQPPSAYAGPYQFVECTNGKGTATLDSSGSFDPDGDTLQYAWSAPGITFSDPTNVTTEAVFLLGTTTVTLTVKDGSVASNGFSLMDTDIVDVTVQDTKPPVLTPPVAITIFSCKSPNIGMATAVDACAGTTVTITNDAPTTFPLGEITVTWTATDASGNIGTAEQKVRAILGDDPSCCPPGTNIIIGTEGPGGSTRWHKSQSAQDKCFLSPARSWQGRSHSPRPRPLRFNMRSRSLLPRRRL